MCRGQDMGENVETHFQEVLAALEQSAEQRGRAGRGALQARLQQLYSRITDAGTTSVKQRAVKVKGHVLCRAQRLCDSSRHKRKRERACTPKHALEATVSLSHAAQAQHR